MAKVKADGILRHMFHGTYSAAIGLSFESEAWAEAALASLGSLWKVGKNKKVLVAVASGNDLDQVKEQLDRLGRKNYPCGYPHCEHACKDAPIDSLNHSIDLGPRFSIEVECIAPEQQKLF